MVKITARHDVKYNKREVHIELSTSFGSDMIMFLLQRETNIVQALRCSVGSLAFWEQPNSDNIGCVLLCQRDRSEIIPEENGTTFFQSNWRHHFLFLFRIPYVSEEKQRNEPFCRNETADFGRKLPRGIWEPLLEVILNISVERNQNFSFHLTSDRNFRSL